MKSNPEEEKARQRDKYHRLYRDKKKTYECNKKSMDNWKNKFPEKFQASLAIRKLKRVEGLHYHHWSYNEEHFKDVIAMSREDHVKAHRYLVYDQERRMYRTTDNILLDTLDSHIKYIINKIGNAN